MKITAIIPVYNAEYFLKPAIDSILNQTFKDFELLAINDGSTDSSLEILTSFKDSRLKIINNDKNRGIIYTLNRGINEAKGKYIARMDADDIALPERLALQVDYLEKNPNVVLLGGCAEVINQRGKVFDTLTIPLTHKDILNNIFSSNCFIHPSVMFHKSVAQRLGAYDTNAQHAEDYDLWLRIIQEHQVANLPQPLIQYRVHPDQISQTKIKKQRQAADRARFKALKVFEQQGQAIRPKVKKTTRLDRLYGRDQTIGSDYIGWMDIYRKMGHEELVRPLVLPAIRTAPLCRRLYRELFRPITQSKNMNRLRWYKKKAWLLIRNKTP